MTPAPGSIGFAHSKGLIGKAIRLGEWLRFRRGDFYNHVFIVGDVSTDGDPCIIQAVSRGVTDTALLSTVAPGGNYLILPLPDDVDAAKVLAFAKAQVGQRYGYLSIVGLAIRILTPKFVPLPRLRTANSWICSALGAECLRAGGWIHDWPDIYSEVPSEVYSVLTGVSLRDLPRERNSE